MIRSPAEGDTIVALSSGRPPAAIAVIRSSGPNAFHCLEKLSAKAAPKPRVATLRRLRDPASGETIDDALVLCFPAPASATGEDIVEYQCHGGAAVVDRLLSCLTALPGVRPADPGEFTRRAFVNGRIDLTEAEGLADLLEAETEAQRKAALLVAEGGIRRTVEDWRSRLVDLSARAEAAIDYVGDEDETAVDVAELRASAGALAAELQEWLSRPRAELLKGGIRIVAAGPPNAGKSSLINALAGVDKAIVTDIAGTTRDVIEVPVAMDGLPLVLVDTAGVRESDDPVERIGVARAQAELARADILLWLGEPDDAPSSAIRVHARCDMAGRGEAPLSSIAVAAPSGVGLGELWSAILQRAEPLVPAEGQVALNRRQAGCISDAEIALAAAAADEDLVILAHQLAEARRAFERLTGRSGVEDMLEALFSRFCLGK